MRADRAADAVFARQKSRSFRDRGEVVEGRLRTGIAWRDLPTAKQWRGLATRYDKLAAFYGGGVVLRAITIWLNDLSGVVAGGLVSCVRLASSAQRSCGTAANSRSMAALSTRFELPLLQR